MDVPTSSLFAKAFRFACACTLLLSGNSGLALTLCFLGDLNDDGIALIIVFSLIVLLFLIIYILDLANVAVFEGKHQ
jgi:hypothetical protein